MELQEYYEKYGSEEYGSVAYSLDRIRFSTLGIGITMLWGIAFIKNKNLILSKILKYLIIAVLVITQLLPLGYTMYISNMDRETSSSYNKSTNNENLYPIKEY